MCHIFQLCQFNISYKVEVLHYNSQSNWKRDEVLGEVDKTTFQSVCDDLDTES